MLKKTLSIAGFDGSGGAGIQADLKTFAAFGCYGMTVLTALPIQNTLGVKKCYDIPLAAIQDQLEAIFEDLPPDSIKVGMLFSAEIIDLVFHFLKNQSAAAPLVLDPVMYSKNGNPLLKPEAIRTLIRKALPLTTLLTPNIPEALALLGRTTTITVTDLPKIATQLLDLGPLAVLVKGGHLRGEQSSDFYQDYLGNRCWIHQPRLLTPNTHGTGCTLSAAITASLALGDNLMGACRRANDYLHRAMLAHQSLKIGQGKGPVCHGVKA